LKIDLISGTIREAMANGLPVVTTITPATPKLNENRKSVLLSEKEDFNNMASNMLDLLDNEDLYNTLQANGYATVIERYDNGVEANLWREAYYAVHENKKNGTPIPDRMLH
jgi:glycosyltransferase involved in cell wall biosynthesis